MYFAYMYIFATCACSVATEVRRGYWNALEVEFRMVVSCHVSTAIQSWPSERATNTPLNQ